MTENESKIYSLLAILFLLTPRRMSAAGESGDDKVRRRFFFHSSAPSSSVRKRKILSHSDQEKRDRLVSGGEEKRAMRGSTSAINRSHDCRRISVPHFVLRVSHVLLVLRWTAEPKWCHASANWEYYGYCSPWRFFSMACRRWRRSARLQPVSGILKI